MHFRMEQACFAFSSPAFSSPGSSASWANELALRSPTRPAVLSTPPRFRTAPCRHARWRMPAENLNAAAPLHQLLLCLTAAAAAGNLVGTKTRLGRAFTSPVCIMLLVAILANTGVLPASTVDTSTVRAVQLLLVSVATPILLLQGNLVKSFREARRLMAWFAVAAAGTVLGGVLASALCTPWLASMGPEGAKVVAALIAKNIGGGINFVAVSVILGISPPVVAAATCADSLLCLAYFPAISSLANLWCAPSKPKSRPQTEKQQISSATISTVLAIAFAILVLARSAVGTATNRILPVASLLAVSLATFGSHLLPPLLPTADLLGKVLLDLYFATAGAGTREFWRAWSTYGILFPFCGIMYLLHLAVVAAAGHFIRRAQGSKSADLRLLLLASNANVGGPATAGAMATSKGWTAEVSPAYLVGQFGNAVATFIGLGVYSFLSYAR